MNATRVCARVFSMWVVVVVVASCAAARLQIEDDVVVDIVNERMWERNVDKTGPRSWNDAVAYCEQLQLGGYSDWRLPTMSEADKVCLDGSEGNVDPSESSGSTPLGSADDEAFPIPASSADTFVTWSEGCCDTGQVDPWGGRYCSECQGTPPNAAHGLVVRRKEPYVCDFTHRNFFPVETMAFVRCVRVHVPDKESGGYYPSPGE